MAEDYTTEPDDESAPASDFVTLPMTVRQYQDFIANLFAEVSDVPYEDCSFVEVYPHHFGKDAKALGFKHIEVWPETPMGQVLALFDRQNVGLVRVYMRRPTPGIYRTADLLLKSMRNGEAM